ncbi:hypothetical protein [Shouchella miscanthi]|uniref:Uncharacterized protein n=1 Tax=Shouchella miscanthi TaxID=2598861 RepID=A0ABU6NNE2_9BACI|nr:hypothetical protein [Shouchella miscanthi]
MKPLNFDVFFSNNEWHMATKICNVGGCYESSIIFPTKDEALKEALYRTNKNEKMNVVGMCEDCRNDFMDDDWH